MIDENNYEWMLFQYCEDLLNDVDKAKVEQAISDNPDWKTMVEDYLTSERLPLGRVMEYTQWKQLQDGGKQRKRVAWWPWLSAAACLMIGLNLLFFSFKDGQTSVNKDNATTHITENFSPNVDLPVDTTSSIISSPKRMSINSKQMSMKQNVSNQNESMEVAACIEQLPSEQIDVFSFDTILYIPETTDESSEYYVVMIDEIIPDDSKTLLQSSTMEGRERAYLQRAEMVAVEMSRRLFLAPKEDDIARVTVATRASSRWATLYSLLQ